MTETFTTIHRSTVFDAPVDRVWSVMRDFNDWPSWLSVLEGSSIEGGGPSDAVGCVRVLQVQGDTPRERLLALSDHDHLISYGIVEAKWPVMRDYVATIRLRPITDGDRTFAEWTGSFHIDAAEAEATGQAIAAMVYEGGFAGVRDRLAQA